MEPIYFEDETGGCNASSVRRITKRKKSLLSGIGSLSHKVLEQVCQFSCKIAFFSLRDQVPRSSSSSSSTSNLETNAILLFFLYPLTTFTTSLNNLPVPFLPVIFHIAPVILEQMKRNRSESSVPFIRRIIF